MYYNVFLSAVCLVSLKKHNQQLQLVWSGNYTVIGVEDVDSLSELYCGDMKLFLNKNTKMMFFHLKHFPVT